MRTTLWTITATLAFSTVIAAAPALAHYVWIERGEATHREGSAQVKIFFGEFQEGLREEKGGRLDERDGLKAWLLNPTGERSEIKLSKETNHFAAEVRPSRPGVYEITAVDQDDEVKDWTEYGIGLIRPIMYARSEFLFTDGRVSERLREIGEFLDLDIVPVTRGLDPESGQLGPVQGEEMTLQVRFREQPFNRQKLGDKYPDGVLRVYAPNGWGIEVRLDPSGVGTFQPLWPGQYVAEYIHLEKTPGKFKGREYEAIRHRATYAFTVHPSD